jgi:hypothetical protein
MMPNFFQTFLNQVGQRYKEADKAAGGWLPGGGTASPITTKLQRVLAEPRTQLLSSPRPYTRIAGANPLSPVFDPKGQITPQAAEMLKQLGSSASVTRNINETNPVALLGEKFGYAAAAHANPFKNQIYLPVGSHNTLSTLAHEAGHLDKSRRTGFRPMSEGIGGQILDVPAAAIKGLTGGEFSPFSQTLAPFRLAGGMLTALSDAKEEDYAERFAYDATKKMLGVPHNMQGGNPEQGFTYPSNLYRRGVNSFNEGAYDLLIPPVGKAAINIGQTIQNQIQEALPKPPNTFEDIPSSTLQQFVVESDLDYQKELKENPNSRLLPRLKKIKEDYAHAAKTRNLN